MILKPTWLILAWVGMILTACQSLPLSEAPSSEPVKIASVDETFGGVPAHPWLTPLPSPTPTTRPPTPTSAPLAPTTNYGPAPEIDTQVWLNTDMPLRLADLRGKVVLIEFWTYG